MKQEGMLDWFAKLFWPKEMKELVAKYEAEGTLNDEAVKSMKNIILTYFFVFGTIAYLITIILSSNYISIFIMSPIALGIIVLGSYPYTNSFFRGRFIPYTNGFEDKARLESVKKDFYGSTSPSGTFYAVYYYRNKQYLCKCIKPSEKSFFDEQGNQISIFVHPTNPKYNIPNICIWHKKYNLRMT